jgi:hypothetical protein
VSLVFVAGNGCVGSNNLLLDTLGRCCQRNVLADGQAQNVCGLGQGKSVDGDIVGGGRLFLEREFLEYIRLEDGPRS